MLMNCFRISYLRGIMVGLLPMLALIIMQIAAAKTATVDDIPNMTGSNVATSYQWNVKERELPLLGFSAVATMPTRMAMIAMITSSSTRVKPRRW